VSRKKGQPDDNAVSDLSRGPPETLRAAGDLFFFFFARTRVRTSVLRREPGILTAVLCPRTLF